VPHFDEAFARLAADALCGRLRSEELRMGGFESLKFAHQNVVFSVGDDRLIEYVVKMLVPSKLVAKLLDFTGYRVGHSKKRGFPHGTASFQKL